MSFKNWILLINQ